MHTAPKNLRSPATDATGPHRTVTAFHTTAPRLILGSSSPYRRELLARLGLPFETCSPDVDERPLPGEPPKTLALRLSHAKAQRVASVLGHDQPALVIGSDQVADLHGQCIGKPGDHERATQQLRAMSGQTVYFHTAVTLWHTQMGHQATELHSVAVRFRELDEDTIEQYLQAEQPYDCAGSAKAEGLGIALLEAIDSNDPTALIGLPLIAVARLLRQAGLDPLTRRHHP